MYCSVGFADSMSFYNLKQANFYLDRISHVFTRIIHGFVLTKDEWFYHLLASRAPPFSSWVICRFVSVHMYIAPCFSGHTWLQLRLRLPHWDVSVQSVEVEAKQFGLGLADTLFPPDDGMTFKIAHAVQVMESVSSELHIAIGKFADHIYNRSVLFFYLWHLVVTRNKHA